MDGVERTWRGREGETHARAATRADPPYAHKIFLRQIGEIFADVKAEVERWDGAAYYPAPIDGSSDSVDFGSGDEGMQPVPQSR